MAIKHKTLAIASNHKAHRWEYADETARLAATGFDDAEIFKLALQLSDNTLWILTGKDPTTWVPVSGDSDFLVGQVFS